MADEKDDSAPDIDEVKARVREDFDLLRGAIERRRDELFDEVVGYVDSHPLAALGAAFGAGYVLSGALVSRLTLRLVSLTTRALVGNALRQSIADGLGLASDRAGSPHSSASATARS